ncbi:MAG: hypothetical protein Q9217_001144 [Psora testacea]
MLCTLPLLIYASAVDVTEIPPSTVPVDSSSLQTTNGSFQSPPKQFAVKPEYRSRSIPVTDTLINTISALLELSLQDVKDVMPPTTFTTPDHSNVCIRFLALAGKERWYKKQYAIWGLSGAITVMVEEKKFVQSQWYLYWNLERVGIIWYKLQDGYALDTEAEAGSTTATNESILAGNSGRIRDLNITRGLAQVGDHNSDPPSEVNLTITLEFTRGSLTIFDVFLTTIHVLSDEAVHDPNEIVQPLSYMDLQNNVIVKFGNNKVPARTTDPKFYYGYLFRTLWQIPQIMLDERKFGNAEFRLEVDDIPVGDGSIKKRGAGGGSASLAAVEVA